MKTTALMFSVVALAVSLTVTFPAHAGGGERNLRGNTDVKLQGLPKEKEGKFPIHIPTYEGIDQILVLNNRWVIVGVSYDKDVTEKIDDLSSGKLKEMCDRWEASSKAGRPDWNAYHGRGKLRQQYLTEARKAVGEEKLNNENNFSITSTDDAAYTSAKHPLEVTQLPRPLGGNAVKYSGNIHWGNYCFLRLPEPMKNGKHYTITLGDGKKATFLYDEMHTVSRAIKVNQIGYLPDAGKKYAYMGAYLYELGPLDLSEAKTFKVINAATGKTALEGNVELVAKNPRFAPRPNNKNDDPAKRPLMYGEDVYRMDLGPLKETGEFFISVPGVGRSWTFRHAPDAYGEAFYTAARGLYHQRCGIALDKPYTAWPRKKSDMHDTVYEADYIAFPAGSEAPKGYAIFDAIGGTIDKSKKTKNVIGGWHDAADWDRNGRHYSCVFDMLNAYELAPKKFTDKQLNLPESGNGVPDILDEVEFGLRVWAKSMNEKGGVSGFVETHTHPKMEDPNCPYAFSKRTRADSLIFAAAAAQYAKLVKPFNAKLAEQYAALAKKAFAFGSDPANSMGKVTLKAKKKRGRGEEYTYEWEEKENYVVPFLIHAKLQMYKLTGEKSYLKDIPELFKTAKKPWEWRFSLGDFSNWLYFDIANAAADALPEETVAAAKALYVDKANSLLKEQKGIPYGYTLPNYKNYWLGWGASCMTNHNRPLYCAYVLTGDKKYRDAAIQNADFMLGANPLGMSWTSGMGYAYPIDFQHWISETDGVMDPFPGITIYGTTGGPIYHTFRNGFWDGKDKDGKKISFIKDANRWPPLWRSFAQHPTSNTGQCEFTVHETMAGNIFNAAMLMSEDWTPSDTLKQRGPRKEEYLFGYWMLP